MKGDDVRRETIEAGLTYHEACGKARCLACDAVSALNELEAELATERDSIRHERAAMAAVNERLERELAELRGVVKAYGDDPDYARSRFREIDLLKDQRAHDRLKIDGLERELRGRGAGPVAGEGMAWREALADLAEDLEAEVRQHYGANLDGSGVHPAQQAKYDRDMEPVLRARKLLAAHPSVSAGERAQLGHDPYSVIVRTAKGADVEAFIAFVEKAGGSVRHRLTAISALGVDLPHGWPFEMVAKIVKHPAVRDVQTNHYMRICSPDSAVLPAPTEPAK